MRTGRRKERGVRFEKRTTEGGGNNEKTNVSSTVSQAHQARSAPNILHEQESEYGESYSREDEGGKTYNNRKPSFRRSRLLLSRYRMHRKVLTERKRPLDVDVHRLVPQVE